MGGPGRGQRGIGSALFAQASKIAAGNRRTVLQAEVDAPMSGVSPGSEFARACGFTLANPEVHRVLELPLSEALLDELTAKTAERHEGYRMVTWRDRCPDELVDAYLVKPAHRGHRLGLAMKVRNHRHVQDALDGPVVAHTWNAEQNTHMNAINALLGYRQVEHCQEWQRQL